MNPPIFQIETILYNRASMTVVLKLFTPAADFATFPNSAAHLDQSEDLFGLQSVFHVFLYLMHNSVLHKSLEFLCNFL